MMRCKYWDCGWCYCKTGNSNDINGKCMMPKECNQLTGYITEIISINTEASKSGGFVTRNVVMTSVMHGEMEITK